MINFFDLLTNKVNNFVYLPDENKTFKLWYNSFGDIFENNAKKLTNESRVNYF